MTRRERTAQLSFEALTVEGSLISPAMLARIAAQQASDQRDEDYRVPKGLTLREEVARYFRIGQALFKAFRASEAPSSNNTVQFVQELLRDVFRYADIAKVGHRSVAERTFAVTLEALSGRLPVVVVPPSDELDRVTEHLPGDGRRRSASSAIQDWLNASDGALWGLCTNGLVLRLVRDNESLTRPAYIEADLRQIFENESFADFTLLWLLLDATRFGTVDAPVAECVLERWREAGAKEGVAARDRLRDGFEAALLALGNGFLIDARLREKLASGELPLTDYFGQLLHLAYRLIFLLVAEDRGLLHPPSASVSARRIYAEGYSVSSLRGRSIRRANWDAHQDQWKGLVVTFGALRHGEQRLGLPALGGLFGPLQMDDLASAQLPNRLLMEAIFRLTWLRDDKVLAPINWRDMQAEELGSVYEGLLELTPRLSADDRKFFFAEGNEGKGNARKTSGSYYTPESLVQALLDSALDPVLDRVESEAHDPADALLGVTVIDPACGSGHFLLAAARRIATRVARARAGGVASANDYRHALRDVARRCIHGVDRNPMAVELTKVALWIETVEPGKPLGFLDANIRCGDALLGVFDMKVLEQGIPDEAYKPLTGDDKDAAKILLKDNSSQRERQGDLAAGFTEGEIVHEAERVLALPEDDVEDIEKKHREYDGWRKGKAAARGWMAADLYVAAFLRPKHFREMGMSRASVPDRVPTTVDVRAALVGRVPHPETMAAALDIADAARAFHWTLEFPAVMAKGGFDCVLGNPPWERIKLQEHEFFASRAPEIAEAATAAERARMIDALRDAPAASPARLLHDAFETAKRVAEAASVFARVPGDSGGRFPLTGHGDVNTYALFAEHFARLANPRGRAGVIVPTGVATDATTAPFFGALIEGKRLAELTDFENRGGLFADIDSRMKFSLLTIGSGIDRARFAFFLTDPSQMAEPNRQFTLTPEEIARINPNTKTAPVFRSRADAELTAKLYTRVPMFGTKNRDGWRPQFFKKMFDFGIHRELLEFTATRPSSEHVPLYEAKMVMHFNHRASTYEGVSKESVAKGSARYATIRELADPNWEPTFRCWTKKDHFQRRMSDRDWTRGWLLCMRDKTNATNERTAIFGVRPYLPSNDTLPSIFVDATPKNTAALLANLSSLVVDFVARQKVGGLNLAAFIVEQLPILPPGFYTNAHLDFITPRVLELAYTSHTLAPFARDLGYSGPPFAWDEDRRASLLADLDAFYAKAYGLTRDELRHILDPADLLGPEYPSETFRVLKTNEVKLYGEYRTRRLVLEAWDRLEAGDSISIGSPVASARPIANPLPFESLPSGAWSTPSGGNIRDRTLAQLAAVLKALPGSAPATLAIRTAIYAMEPRLLTPHLPPTQRAEWLRLVGPEAQERPGVTSLGLGGATGWGDAKRALRASGCLVEDTTAGTWTPGVGLDAYFTDTWPRRAEFAFQAASTIVAEDSAISTEEMEALASLAA